MQQRQIAELACFLRERNQQFAIASQPFRLTRDVFGPHFLDVFESHARVVEQRLMALRGAGGGLRVENHAVEIQQLLRLAQARRRLPATGDGVIHIALRRRGVGGAPGGEIAQQKIDAAEHRLDARRPFRRLRIGL